MSAATPAYWLRQGDLQACLQIWSLPLRRMGIAGSGRNTLLVLLSVLICLVPAIVLSGTHRHMVWIGAVVVPYTLVSILWWIRFMTTVLVQGTPVLAHMIPTLLRRLRLATIAMWLMLSVTFAALLSIAGGHFLSYFLLAGLAMACQSVLMIWPSLGYGGVIFLLFVQRSPLADVQGLFFSAPVSWGMAVTLLLVGWHQLRYLFPADGGRARGRRRGAFGLPRLLSTISGPRTLAGARPNERVRMSASFPTLLRRDCQQRNRGALLMHALGPFFHIYFAVRPLAVMAALCAALIHFSRYPPILIWILLFALPLMVMTQELSSALGRNRGEQALLRLAPLMPQGSQLNRLLAIELLRRFALLWAAMTLTMLLIGLVCGDAAATLLLTLARCSSFLLLAGTLLRNYARPARNAVAWLLLAVVVIMAAVGWWDSHGWPWMSLHLPILLLAAVYARVRWSAMLAAPPAFPGDRIA